MRRMLLAFASIVLIAPAVAADKPRTYALTSADGLELVNVKADAANYRGRAAVRLVPAPGTNASGAAGEGLAILSASDFDNGTIEVDVSGAPLPGAVEGARGFIGVAFRVQPKASRFECFYVRPTNGRADDQLRRNHSTQYISYPDFPWERLRRENPGVYESYTDLEPGVWTKLRIAVSGTKAQLYVNGSPQPVLIVNDLKAGASRGKIALWIGLDTDGYFSGLTVR